MENDYTFLLLMFCAWMYLWGGIINILLAAELAAKEKDEYKISWFDIIFWPLPGSLIKRKK